MTLNTEAMLLKTNMFIIDAIIKQRVLYRMGKEWTHAKVIQGMFSKTNKIRFQEYLQNPVTESNAWVWSEAL